MSKRSRYLAAALMLPPLFAVAGDDHAQAAVEIRQVVESFRMAIIRHDGQGLKALFLPEQGNWLSVMHDELYRKIRTQHPEAVQIRQSNHVEFADFVANAKTPVEEKFYNVRVETNGTIGTVYFDFDFLDNGKVENRGAETWQLIHTEAGWKIAAMLYSSRGG